MKKLVALVMFVASSAALAQGKRCYQLSTDGQLWSRTPELLCVVDAANAQENAVVTLTTGLMPKTIATFNLNLLERVRCLDCNRDVYGVANPSNSIFNQLKISFDGQRPFVNGAQQRETGTLQVGDTTFYYRAL